MDNVVAFLSILCIRVSVILPPLSTCDWLTCSHQAFCASGRSTNRVGGLGTDLTALAYTLGILSSRKGMMVCREDRLDLYNSANLEL